MSLCNKLYLKIFFCILGSNFVIGQNLTVTPLSLLGLQPEDIILNTFLGEGVDVLSITYNGEPVSIGIFKDGFNQIGIDKGIIITSGDAALADDENNAGGTGAPSSGPSNDFDLENLTTADLFDLAFFEIEFIPTADSLQFKYVFASDEYPEYACSPFNDVFGFFITGPDPQGGNYSAQNIALIPGTNLPVTINNVNPGVVGSSGTIENCTPPLGTLEHAEFYNDNPTGTQNLTYDGYLDVFVAEAEVIPCEVYTMKIAIADVSDGAFDSGVFLEAKSFKTNTIIVEAATISLDGTITEDCAGGILRFRLPEITDEDFPIDLNIFGSADNGIDYALIPDTVTIPAGFQEIEIPVIAFDDGIIEADEFIAIDIQRDICNRDTFYFFIRDNELIPPEIGNDTLICQGDTMSLDGTLPIILPPPPSFTSAPITINQTNTPFFSDIMVFGVQPTNLHLEAIQSICIDSLEHQWIGDIDIYLLTPGGQLLELSTDNGGNGGNGGGIDYYIDMCFTVNAVDEIHHGEEQNGALPTNLPFTGFYQPEGDWEDIVDGDYPTNGIWRLLILDDTQGFGGTLSSWTITFEPAYKVFYEWFPKEGLSCYDCPDPKAFPDTTTTYKVVATDIYGCNVSDSITVTVYETIPAPDVYCFEEPFQILWTWDSIPGIPEYEVNIDGNWVNPNNGNLSHIITGLGLDSTITIEVRAISDCGAEITAVTCSTPPCAVPTANIVPGSVQHVNCFGGADGAFEIDAQAQFPPVSFDIGNGSQNSGLFSNLKAGNYNITVTDDQSCEVEVSVEILQPDTLIMSQILLSNVSCNGLEDGAATFEITGGTLPYSFTWNNGNTDSIASNLAPGFNTLTVEDANGCIATGIVEIMEPDALITNTGGSDATCFDGSDGWVSVQVQGGTGPYDFLWDDSFNQTTDTAFNLHAGQYNVTVTDANGCQIIASEAITDSPQINIQPNSSSPCFGGTNGSIFSFRLWRSHAIYF